MKTLYLMRHAKSSWDDATVSDFDRPLNARGERAARFMCELIREKAFGVERIVSSPAARAMATAQMVHEKLGREVTIEFEERIYEASVGTHIEIIDGLDDGLSHVLLIGHNPGLEGTARYLTDEIVAMPTAAFLVIDLATDSWSAVTRSSGTIRELILPRNEMKRADL